MKISEYIKAQLTLFKKPYYFEENSLIDRQQIIKRINHYKRDKYLNADDPDAIFYNIATPRKPHFKKNIIISIKDFYPEGRGDFNYFQAWITKVRFRKWARDDDFVGDLDKIAENLTDYGECVVKVSSLKGKKVVEVVTLQKIHFDRTIEFDVSNKIEIHELTEAQIRSKDNIWNDVDKIIEKAEIVDTKDSGSKKYIIYEFWGSYKEDEKSKIKFIHQLVAGSGDKEVIVYDFKSDKEDKPVYYYFKLNDELIGLFERLFILQVLMNKRVNQNDESQSIASLLLLKSKDPDIKGNVLKEAISGQILSADLEQIAIDNRALNGYLAEMATIENQADRLALTPEVITGGDTPSGVPFRSTAAMINKAMKAFKSIRTNIANNVIKMLETEIFPAVVKNWDDEYLDIADNESDIIDHDRWVGQYLLNDWVGQIKDQTGFFPTPIEIEEKRTEIINNFATKGRRVFIEKGFFNWDYGFIYNATNEVEDRAQQNDVMTNLLALKMSNPAIANDPLFKQLAEKNGVSAYKVSQREIQDIIDGRGGEPAPSAPNIAKKEDKLMATIDTV